MRRRNAISVLVLACAALAIWVIFPAGVSPITLAGLALNLFRSNGAAGNLVVDRRPGASVIVSAEAGGDTPTAEEARGAGTWASYNRTLTSQRYSPLTQIDTRSVHALSVSCTYDTHLHEGFETGPIMVEGALIGTTALDVFSIDPATCRENWRAHENYKVSTPLTVNRGAAYLDGRLFRGTLDGRVLAYDFITGHRLWSTTIADPETGEIVDAAPIAWNGLVFIGTALGDMKGVKGRMYALDALGGRIVWETYLVPKGVDDPARGPEGQMPASAVDTWKNAAEIPISGGGSWTSYTLDPVTGRLYVPVGNPSPDYVRDVRKGTNLYTDSVLVLDAKTGNYVNHFQPAAVDWHDWDVSNTPAIFITRGGKQLLAFDPKDGHLYGYDLTTGQRLYRSAVTRMENSEAPLSTDKPTHFCPGTPGGGEWNGVAYDPRTNLVLTGELEWCSSIKLQTAAQIRATANGAAWTGNSVLNPLDFLGTQDPHSRWAGWLYATDADTGEWRWRARSNYPILSGVTATAGGLVFFGDMGGHLYALESSTGRRLWSAKLQGAIAGGVITYAVNGSQKVAVAAGLTSILWPTEVTTAKIVILGLDDFGK